MAKNRQRGPRPTPSTRSAEKPPEPPSRWKDRITIIALWGAIVATVVAGRDTYIQLFVAHIPEFYVRTKLEVATDNNGKQIAQLVVRIANIGSETATLDPGLYVLTIDSKNGKMEEAHLTFSELVANTSTPAYIPGQPPNPPNGRRSCCSGLLCRFGTYGHAAA
jgi:hypothetical protein